MSRRVKMLAAAIIVGAAGLGASVAIAASASGEASEPEESPGLYDTSVVNPIPPPPNPPPGEQFR